MSDIRKKDDDWFGVDQPLDTEGLDTIQTIQQVIWDDNRPGLTHWWRTTNADDNTPTTFARRFCAEAWECMFLVPIVLQPGDKSIKAHFRGRGDGPVGGGVYLQFSEGLVSTYDPTDQSTLMDLVTGQDFEVKVMTLDNLVVPVPRLTFLQFWYRSVPYDAAVSLPITPHLPPLSGHSRNGPYVMDKEGLLTGIAAAAVLPEHLYFFNTYASGNSLGQRKILDWNTAILFAAPSGSETSAPSEDGVLLFPRVEDFGTGATTHGYSQANWVEPRSLHIEIIRESSAPPSKFYTVRDSDIRPGKLTKSKIGTALVAGNNTLRFRKRPFLISMPTPTGTEGVVQSGETDQKYRPSCRYDFPNDTLHAYEEYATLSKVGAHTRVRLFAIIGAVEAKFPRANRRDMVEAKITLEMMDAGATAHVAQSPVKLASTTFSVPFTNVTREGNLFQFWESTWAEGCLSPEDVDQLLAGDEFVVVELTLDGLDDGAALGADFTPDILRLKFEALNTATNTFSYSIHMATFICYQESAE